MAKKQRESPNKHFRAFSDSPSTEDVYCGRIKDFIMNSKARNNPFAQRQG